MMEGENMNPMGGDMEEEKKTNEEEKTGGETSEE